MEVDGPSHFTANTREELSMTLFRRKCLEARGWRVINVPHFVWYEGRGAGERERYVCKLLREAGLDVVEPSRGGRGQGSGRSGRGSEGGE